MTDSLSSYLDFSRLRCSLVLPSQHFRLKSEPAFLWFATALNWFWLASFYAYASLAFHVLTFQAAELA